MKYSDKRCNTAGRTLPTQEINRKVSNAIGKEMYTYNAKKIRENNENDNE